MSGMASCLSPDRLGKRGAEALVQGFDGWEVGVGPEGREVVGEADFDILLGDVVVVD
jgi:hypothetical protein